MPELWQRDPRRRGLMQLRARPYVRIAISMWSIVLFSVAKVRGMKILSRRQETDRRAKKNDTNLPQPGEADHLLPFQAVQSSSSSQL